MFTETFTYNVWNVTRTQTSFVFDRGFTGHEHHYDFGLINMNGRMYDPMMSSFLSPDDYVQEPVSLQSLNRYAYCLYNPLRYIDPSGYRMTDPPHTSMVIDYVSQMNTSGVYDSDLMRQLNLHGITDIEYVHATGYPGETIRWSEGNYEYTYSYESDMNDGTLSRHYIGGYGAGYNYPVFVAGGGSYSIPNANLTGNGGGGMSVASTAATVAGTGASTASGTSGKTLNLRPDNDGKLTFYEARDWWRNGDGQSLMIDINSLDLSNVHLSDFNNDILNINFAGNDFNITNINDALVYGNIQLKHIGNGYVVESSCHDIYDFNMIPWSKDTFIRNVLTIVGRIVNGSGTPYIIWIYGKAKVNP